MNMISLRCYDHTLSLILNIFWSYGSEIRPRVRPIAVSLSAINIAITIIVPCSNCIITGFFASTPIRSLSSSTWQFFRDGRCFVVIVVIKCIYTIIINGMVINAIVVIVIVIVVIIVLISIIVCIINNNNTLSVVIVV